MRLILIISFLLSFGASLDAQTNIATQSNGWYMYFGNHRLNDRLGIHTEYQWRRHNWLPAWQQSLLRLGLDYHFDANNSLTVGYAWVVSYPYGEQPIAQEFTEHRIWEQLVFTHRAGVLYVHHRYRLEQRYLERPAQSDYAFRQRARYRLLLTLPISERDLQDDSFFLATYAEPFIGFGKGIGRNVLDQNRLYIALGYRFNPNVNIQAGYLNQYIIKIDGIHHERNHNFQLGMTYNIDFRM